MLGQRLAGPAGEPLDLGAEGDGDHVPLRRLDGALVVRVGAGGRPGLVQGLGRRRVEQGRLDKDDNPLKNAPHTALELVGEWHHAYSREQAVYPLASLIEAKYWPPVGRVDNVYGDRNLVCACPSIEAYQDA